MSINDPKLSQMFSNDSMWFKMIWNGLKWSEIVSNNTKRSQMDTQFYKLLQLAQMNIVERSASLF